MVSISVFIVGITIKIPDWWWQEWNDPGESENVSRQITQWITTLTWIEQKNYHFLAVTENLWFLKLVLESMTTPIRIPKIK